MMIVKYPIKSQYAWMKRTEGEKKTDWCSITNEMRDEALVSPTSISAIVQWDWDVERIIMTIRPFWFSIRIRFNMQKWEWVFSFCFVCGFFVPRRVSNIKNSNSTIASNQTDYQIFSASFPTIFLTISKPFSANCHSRNFNQFRSIPRERHIHIEMWPIWSTDEVLNCVACIGFIDGLKVVKHLLKSAASKKLMLFQFSTLMQFSVEHHEWNCNDMLHIRWLQPHATAQFECSFVHMPLKILGNFHFYGFQDKMLFSNVIQMENVPMNEFIGFIGDRIDVVFVVNFEMPTSQWNESAPHSTDIQTLCSSTNNHIIMIDWIIKSVAHFMSENIHKSVELLSKMLKSEERV